MSENWIQSRDGAKIDLMEPDYRAIDPCTLSVVLARKCRFGGHTIPFYSVAQHSLVVEKFVLCDALKLSALLHDAHEAYWGFGDITTPAKSMDEHVSIFLEKQARIFDVAIARRFGVDFEFFRHPEVKRADALALSTEVRDLMEDSSCELSTLPNPHFDKIEAWGIEESYQRFSSRLYELWTE